MGDRGRFHRAIARRQRSQHRASRIPTDAQYAAGLAPLTSPTPYGTSVHSLDANIPNKWMVHTLPQLPRRPEILRARRCLLLPAASQPAARRRNPHVQTAVSGTKEMACRAIRQGCASLQCAPHEQTFQRVPANKRPEKLPRRRMRARTSRMHQREVRRG